MNNEKLRADIQVVIQYAPNHPLSELLNRCYVALGEQQASVPDGWRQVPFKSLERMLMLIDPEPVRMPNGDTMVFKNPHAGAALREISAEFRAMLAATQPVAAQPANTGHGHVTPRPDGVRMRCGGPSICTVCAMELAEKQAQPAAAILPEQDGSDAQISFWAGYEFAVCGFYNGNIRTAWNDFKGSEQFKRLNRNKP